MNSFQQRLCLLVVFFFSIVWCHSTYAQEAKLELLGDFFNCSTEDEYTLSVTNITPDGIYDTYKIKWGDGEETILNSYGTDHIYKKKGRYSLIFFGQRGAITDTKEYTVYNDGVTPSLTLDAGGEGGLCIGDEIHFVLSSIEKNTILTEYTIDFGDGSAESFVGAEYQGQSEIKFTHKYTKSQCDAGANDGMTVEIRAMNSCKELFKMTAGPYKVANKIELELDFPEKECTGNFINLSDLTKDKPNDCMNTIIKWEIVGDKALNEIDRFSERGEYLIRATATKENIACSKGSDEKILRIIQRVKAVVSPLKYEICEGTSINLDASISEGDENEYTWSVISGDANNVVWNPDINSGKVTATFTEHGSYKLQVYITNGCSSDEEYIDVVVKKNPEIVEFKVLPNTCPDLNIYLSEYIFYDWTWEGNPQEATWTITDSKGIEYDDVYALNTDKNSPEPILNFSVPGDYTLKVELNKVAECEESTKLTEIRKIHIYDDVINLTAISPKKTDICENETIEFTGVVGIKNEITRYWNVTTENGRDVTDDVDTNGMKITFPHFGEYIATLTVQGPCGSLSKSFNNIIVRRAPEIVLGDLYNPCPGMEFNPGWDVTYKKNGNRDVPINWKLTNIDETSFDGATIIDGTTRYPKITFSTSGVEVWVEVTLTNPTQCEPIEPLTSRKKIKILDPLMELDIVPDETTICNGETVSFTNTSMIGEEDITTYNWVITPEEGSVFDATHNKNSREPEIKFTKSGRYYVEGNVSGACDDPVLTYWITVKEDPQVVINNIPEMCPGVLDLNEALVEYNWNDSWVGSSDKKQIAKWTLISEPSGADRTPNTDEEWSKHHPKLEFNTLGPYELQVVLNPIANCGDSRPVTKTFTVYDPELYGDAMPKADTDLKGSDKNYEFIEGKELSFENNVTGEIRSYLWSVDKPENCTISDATAKEPTITFNEHGFYYVTLKVNGACDTLPNIVFTFDIKGVPKFDFAPIPNRCDNWEGEEGLLDIGKYLTCDSAGSVSIGCNWDIVPNSGYALEGSTRNDMYPKIRFTENGVYNLTLYAEAEFGGEQEIKGKVNVLNSVITVDAQLTKTEGCTGSTGLEVKATNETVGDSLIYTWTMTPEEGRTISVDVNDDLNANVLEAGNYQIKLKAENICTTVDKTFPVRAFSKPEITPIGNLDLGTVCDLDYEFIGADHVGEINVNNDKLESVLWTVSPVGYTFEDGTGASTERPDISFTGGNDKNYVIRGVFKNGCADSTIVEYIVKVDEFQAVELMDGTTLCAHDESILLEATPLGGTWSCSDINALEIVGENSYFEPYKNEDSEFKLTYKRGNGVCLAEDSIKIKVNVLPVVNAGNDLDVCVNHDSSRLIASPSRGDWQGEGVRNGHFHPSEIGVGDFRLEYWYTDVVTSCRNLDTIIMTVHVLPNPNFKVSELQCEGIDSVYTPVQLGVGNSFLWNFGNGETKDTDDVPATYQYPIDGPYKVVLTATSKYGCIKTSDSTELTVLNLPVTADFTVKDTAGCGPFTIKAEIKQSHFEVENSNLEYKWDYGNGNITTALEPVVQTYQAGVYDTIYPLVFKVYNVCGEQLDTINIGAWSKAVAKFVMSPEEEGCSPAEVQFINQSTGSYNTYSWNFDDEKSSDKEDPTHTFWTDAATSFFDIVLTATNRCILNGVEFSRNLKVKPNSIVVMFTKSGKYICAGDTIHFENHTVDRDPTDALSYSWNFEPGVIANVWDTCHRYNTPGAYNVTLKVDNGCSGGEFSDSVFVHKIPTLVLDNTLPICEDLDLEFNMTADQPLKNITWDFGDGSLKENGVFKILHAFQEPGDYVVKVRGEGDQIPSCPNETTTMVKIWSNPRIKISPLDTMACSPFLFQPQITATSFDFITWDYGDGTQTTSETEHLYTNYSDSIKRYHIAAYVENNFGCKEEHKGFLSVYNAPKATWDKEISYGRPEKVKFINLTKDYTEATWYLPSGEIVNSLEDQSVTFNREDVYPISLVVVNKYGCRDSLYQEHRSFEGGLYFPNSFIPHSLNSKVNQFNGIGMGLKEYRLEIFDMYGNKIWETTAIEEGVPSEGWDGKNKDGKPLPQGTYMWRAKAIFFSEDLWTGDNNRSGNTQSTQGTVLLLGQ